MHHGADGSHTGRLRALSKESLHCMRTGAMGTMVFQMGAARIKSHYWDFFWLFLPQLLLKVPLQVHRGGKSPLRSSEVCLGPEMNRSSWLPTAPEANTLTLCPQFSRLFIRLITIASPSSRVLRPVRSASLIRGASGKLNSSAASPQRSHRPATVKLCCSSGF